MNTLKLAVAQFEPKDGNKAYNISVMRALTKVASEKGATVLSFHELCTTAYTFLKDLTEEELDALAEEIPNGPTCKELIDISQAYNIALLAGILEKKEGNYYNSYVCVENGELKAVYRKIHPFISKFLSPGEEYVVFDLQGWKCGILICYDNNVIENVRATTLLGAELIFAPHVTGCTPSAMPGRGYVDDRFWQNREVDPVSLRQEFDGPKGRGWLMRWLPARAYDNGVYYAFSNPIGYDGEHLKNGNAMILDPYGELLTEANSFGDEVVCATLTRDKLGLAGGFRYRNARKPELYRDILSKDHLSTTHPVWLDGE